MADRYIIISGRIEVNKDNLTSNIKGINGTFNNGNTFVPDNETKINRRTISEKKIYRVKQLLKAAIGQPKYSTYLTHKDLSNVIFIFSKTDSRVGQLSKGEIVFLKSKNVKVFSTDHPHKSSIWALADLIKEGKIKL